MSYSIKFGASNTSHVAICLSSDGSVLAAFPIVGEDADPQTALAMLKSATGFDGTWIAHPTNGEIRQNRGRGDR